MIIDFVHVVFHYTTGVRCSIFVLYISLLLKLFLKQRAYMYLSAQCNVVPIRFRQHKLLCHFHWSKES